VPLINMLDLKEWLVSVVLTGTQHKETATNAKICWSTGLTRRRITGMRNRGSSFTLHQPVYYLCERHRVQAMDGSHTYRVTKYYDGDNTLVVELWLHRLADDLSGMTFQEWDPSAGTDDTSTPVTMLINSSELRTTDFHLADVRSLQLDEVARGGRRTRDSVVKNLQGVGNSTFVLSVENDNDFRSRCE
jgi:hypothetical protein